MKNLVIERKLNKIGSWQDETTIRYFLVNDDCNKYKIIISKQTNNENTELEIDKLFNDKQMALDLIALLYENSVPLEQSNEVIHDFIR